MQRRLLYNLRAFPGTPHLRIFTKALWRHYEGTWTSSNDG